MLRTVIMSPYIKDVSGTLEQQTENNSIHIKVHLNCSELGESDILRLYALSTSHAAMSPYLVESFSGETKDFPEAVIYEKDISATGYKLCDIDTYVITKYSSGSETAIAAAFFGLEWSASRFLKNSVKKQHDHKEESPQKDMPLSRAKEILQSRKAPTKNDESNIYAAEFKKNAQKHSKVNIDGENNYDWYKIMQNTVISSLSGVRHALSNKYAAMAINDSGHYLAGICKNDYRHIAIAIPSCRNICPMPQLSDCCNYIDGYHIAGIYLGEDGQYFEKHLQNNEY